jgi:sporulation protein YlmC with PRC-barrel domain
MTLTGFGHELIGREVVDSLGDTLGHLKDMQVDINTGQIIHLLVNLEDNLDPAKLPWSLVDGLMRVPADLVERVATKIHLRP